MTSFIIISDIQRTDNSILTHILSQNRGKKRKKEMLPLHSEWTTVTLIPKLDKGSLILSLVSMDVRIYFLFLYFLLYQFMFSSYLLFLLWLKHI